MPLYYYHCQECDYSFEEFHSVEERDIPVNTICPMCKEESVERTIGAISSVWKCELPTKS